MKKISTLIIIAVLSNLANKSFSQNVYQSFETQTQVNNLATSCWTFNNVNYTSVSPITGTGSVVTQLGSLSEMITPELQIPSTLNISFSYATMATSSGSKTLKIFLLLNGVETQLESINLNSSPSGNYSNSFTNANTPGNNLTGFRKIIFRVTSNASVQIDEVNVNTPYRYAGGCLSTQSPLPVKLVSFQGNLNNNKVSLQWAVAENEINDRFEIERSFDGVSFVAAGSVTASAKTGNENYSFNEIMSAEKIYFRLKMFDKSQVITYSKILAFQNSTATDNNTIKIMGNPVNDKLTISFTSTSTKNVEVKVYDLAGRMSVNQNVKSYEGNNIISLPQTSTLKAGLYIVEINNGNVRTTAKFVKQ